MGGGGGDSCWPSSWPSSCEIVSPSSSLVQELVSSSGGTLFSSRGSLTRVQERGDEGGMREGGSALNLHLRLEEAWLDPSQPPPLVSEEGSRSSPPGSSRCRARGRGRGSSRARGRGRGCRCRRRRGVPSAGTLPLLTPGVGSPSTGGLEPSSRIRHSEDDLTDNFTITVEVDFSMLAASSEFQECLKQYLELPIPSHLG